MIIITGATGFIGSALTWELNLRGHRDLILSDYIFPEERPKILKNRSFLQFVDAKDLMHFLNEQKQPPNYIFHLGACSSTLEKNISYLKENNTDYSIHLFDYCAHHQVPIQYASSAAVYGSGDNGFDDQTPNEKLFPLNAYGWSKLNIDLYTTQAHTTPPHWYGLRFFNVYGPNEYHKQEMSSMVFKAFNQVQENGALTLFQSHRADYADGKQLRDFVYIKDVTRWMVDLMLNSNRIPSGIYNLGFGQARTWLDLAHSVFFALQRPIKINWKPLPIEMRSQYQYFTQAKMDRFLSLGMSTPSWSLEKGIEDYIKNYLLKPCPYL